VVVLSGRILDGIALGSAGHIVRVERAAGKGRAG